MNAYLYLIHSVLNRNQRNIMILVFKYLLGRSEKRAKKRLVRQIRCYIPRLVGFRIEIISMISRIVYCVWNYLIYLYFLSLVLVRNAKLVFPLLINVSHFRFFPYFFFLLRHRRKISWNCNGRNMICRSWRRNRKCLALIWSFCSIKKILFLNLVVIDIFWSFYKVEIW